MSTTVISFMFAAAVCLVRLATQLVGVSLPSLGISLFGDLAIVCAQMVYLHKAKQTAFCDHKAEFRVYTFLFFYMSYAVLSLSGAHVNAVMYAALGDVEFPSVDVIIWSVVAWLVSVITEEFLFRRIFLSSLVLPGKGMLPALLLANGVFAMVHIPQLLACRLPDALLQMVRCFSLGLLCSALYLRSGNMLIPVLTHYADHLLAQYPDALLTADPQFAASAYEASSFNQHGMIVALVYGLCTLALLYRFPYERRANQQQETTDV